MSDFYDRPELYDILHAPGTAAEVDGLERIAARFVTAARRPVWLEPFCGTGRYLRVAAGRGIPSIGVDLHPGMIAYARHRGRAGRGRGRLVHHIGSAESVHRVAGARCADFAFAPINSIRHLESDAAVLAHLASVARCLRPGGVYAVGLDFARYGLDPVEEDVWEGARGPLRITQVCQYLPAAPDDRVETVVSHVTLSRPRGEEHLDFTYPLRSYSREEWREIVGRSSFRIEAVTDGTGEDLDPRVFAYGFQILRQRHGRRETGLYRAK